MCKSLPICSLFRLEGPFALSANRHGAILTVFLGVAVLLPRCISSCHEEKPKARNLTVRQQRPPGFQRRLRHCRLLLRGALAAAAAAAAAADDDDDEVASLDCCRGSQTPHRRGPPQGAAGTCCAISMQGVQGAHHGLTERRRSAIVLLPANAASMADFQGGCQSSTPPQNSGPPGHQAHACCNLQRTQQHALAAALLQCMKRQDKAISCLQIDLEPHRDSRYTQSLCEALIRG